VEPRVPQHSHDIIEYDDITIDRERFKVIHKGRELVLPKKEFELLNLLVSKPDKVFTREDIFGRIWDSNAIVGERTIDVHIRKLREKLGEGYISTVKGVGYKFSRQP
jgi:two-component system alkaline phosphatase synthesis response regulator PhoP